MKKIIFLVLCTTLIRYSVAQSSAPSDTPSDPKATVLENPATRPVSPTWIVPETHIAFVNVNDTVDSEWLQELAASMQRQLLLSIKPIPLNVESVGDALTLYATVRKELSDDAKMVVVIAKMGNAKDGIPILAAPQNGWAVMDADWVTSVKADKATTDTRMRKQLHRALGFAAGTGMQSAPQAIMYAASVPEDLDNALSSNYHPDNVTVIKSTAKAKGIEAIRIQPRSGRQPKPAETAKEVTP